MARPVKRLLMLHVVPPAALMLIRVLGRSWRFNELGRDRLEAGVADGRAVIGAFFHGRLFPLLYRMSRPGSGRWLAMCSKSLDGEAMARVERALGYQVVRGSSGGGGFEALVAMVRALRRDPGLSSCLAVDGSVGPRGFVQPGVVALAQRTGAPILPVGASARPAFVFERSWDRTAVPLPFARVEIVYGDPIDVPARLKRSETEAMLDRVTQAMHAVQSDADRRSGFEDPENGLG